MSRSEDPQLQLIDATISVRVELVDVFSNCRRVPLLQWLAVREDDDPEVLEVLAHLKRGAPVVPALRVSDQADRCLADVRRVEMRRRVPLNSSGITRLPRGDSPLASWSASITVA